jgi:hypothetical protein
LKGQDRVVNLKINEIPYYNAEIPNEKCIEFFFVAKDQEEFNRAMKVDSFERMIYIRNVLGCEQFRKYADD